MNLSRLLQIVLALLLAVPTGFAFLQYAQEAQELGRLKDSAVFMASRTGIPSAPPPAGTKSQPAAKAEEAKPAAKAEEAKPVAEADEAKPAAAKAEGAKPEPAKAEAKPEPAKAEEVKPVAKAEEAKPEPTKAEEAKPAAKAEEGKPGNLPRKELVAKADVRSDEARKDSSTEGSVPEKGKKRRRKATEADPDLASLGDGSGGEDASPGSRRRSREVEDSGDFGQLTLKASTTAEVYLDGRKIGVTPVLGRKVSSGVHRVRFDCLTPEGKKPGVERKVEVLPFSEVSVDYECTP